MYKKYMFFLCFSCFVWSNEELKNVVANVSGAPETPNRCMQALAAIVSCPLIFVKLCSAPNRDPREKNCLHNSYVDPYEVKKDYQENNSCLLMHYCCPCCTPQQLREEL